MGTALILDAPGELRLEEYPEPSLGADAVRVQTLYSGISAGTELAQYRGTTPHARRVWDPKTRLFGTAVGDLRYPITDWGYEEVGRVIEVGAAAHDIELGDVVWGAWGHRSSHVMPAHEAARRKLPHGVDPTTGVFARIGAVALNGILDAQVNIGETAVVFGAGVVGLIVAQLTRLAGARVIAVDRIPQRLDMAMRFGVDVVIDAAEGNVAREIRERTGGRGADVCIEATGVPAALHEAVRAAAYGATVVALGFFQGDARDLRLGEEFHHNRITIVSSQISGVAARLAHRWDRFRLEETIVRLATGGELRLRDLVSHVVPVSRAAGAYETLDQRPEEALQVILEF